MARARTLVAVSAAILAVATSAHVLESANADHRHTASTAPAWPGSGSPALAPVPPRVDKPNILLVMTDDMRADDLKWMPNTRAFFAEHGTDFRNSFAPTPLCCPNRASYLSGKYAHNHHVWWHETPWGYGAFDDSHTIGGALQQAGYQTGYVGKYLNRYGIAAPKADPTAAPWTYVPNGWDDWRATPDAVPVPMSNPLWGSTYNYFATTVNDNGVLEGHQGQYNSNVLVDEGLDVLRQFEGGGKPWYLQLNSLAPHHGDPVESDDPIGDGMETPARPDWVKGRFDTEIQRGLGVPVDGQPERDVRDKARITRRMKPLTDSDRSDILALSRQRAETLFAFDRQLGRVLHELQTSGQLDHTIVAFTSDNGYMEGEHRWRSGKVIGFEPSYRVPLLMAGPGIPEGAQEVMPVNTVNLSASVLDWAGAHLAGTDGQPFVDAIGTGRGWNHALGYEAYFPSIRNRHDVPGFETGDASAVGIRTAQYFYVRYSNGQEELFDLRHDPVELTSVAADPAYAEVKGELRTLWDRFHQCHGAACDLPLPASLATEVATTRELTDLMETETARYYGR